MSPVSPRPFDAAVRLVLDALKGSVLAHALTPERPPTAEQLSRFDAPVPMPPEHPEIAAMRRDLAASVFT